MATEWRRLRPRKAQQLGVKAVTVNIQSLLGKHRFLEEQMLAENVDVIFLQETRDNSGYVESRYYYRLASPAEQYWGTAIWVRRRLTIQGDSCDIQPQHLTLVCSEPRLTVVVLKLENFRLLLGSCYIPQQRHGPEARAKVMAALEAAIDEHCQGGAVLIGVDANARVPSEVGSATGDLVFGHEDDEGLTFAHFVDRLGMILPTTFAEIHCGDSATWRHASGVLSRIDFFITGGGAEFVDMSTWTSTTIDTMCSNDDHWPVVLQAQIHVKEGWQQERRLRRRKYDVGRMMTPDGKAALAAAIGGCRRPAWQMGVDRHAAIIEEDLNRVMQTLFPCPKATPRAQYISQEVWDARCRCLVVKKKTRRWNDGFRAFAMAAAFQCWRNGAGQLTWIQKKTFLMRELFASAIRISTIWTKDRIRRDKNVAFDKFLCHLGGLQGDQLLRALNSFGLGGRARRRGRPPAPVLRGPDGSFLLGRGAHERAWNVFFGAMEGGEMIPTEAFIKAASAGCSADDIEVSLQTVPKLWELEQTYLKVPCHKAAGLDSIPPELLKAAAPEVAALFYPLVLKSSVRIQQPLQWKGGILYESFKTSGRADLLENYRSLYISSVPGKQYHRILRDRMATMTAEGLHGLHCGAKPGASVMTPSLALHLLVRAAKAAGQSAALIYLDTKTAYYSIIRELAIGNIYEDSFAVKMFERFCLSAEDLQELMSIVTSGGILAEEGADEHLLALVRAIYKDGWFVSRHSSGGDVCRTTKGSRPGSSWADLLFTFIYGRILAKVRQVADCEGFGATLRWSGTKELWPSEREKGIELHCLDCTWADDTAAFTMSRTPEDLMRQAESMATELLDACVQYGLRPNFRKNKTMMVISLRGTGSRKIAARCFPGNKQQFEVPSKSGDGYSIHLTAGYIHLGTYLDKDGGLECEAKRRVAMATANFERQKKVVYQNRFLDMKSRMRVFRGAVAASMYNLELWTDEVPGWKTLEQGFQKLQRRMLVGTVKHEDLVRLADAEVQHRTGGMPLTIMVIQKRLGFLASLIANGPEELWAIVQHEGRWAMQVGKDFTWLKRHSQLKWPAVDSAGWPEWWHLIKGRRPWFRKQVSLAAVQARQQWLQEQATTLLLKDMAEQRWGRGWSSGREGAKACHWCMPCRRPFATRSGQGAHFLRIHGRKAVYRSYIHGTFCQACGKEFHTKKRITMHLRWSERCCGVLAALGKRLPEAAPGMRSWKRKADDELVMCPPEKVAMASDVPPDLDRIWYEVPELGVARQAMMDWLVEYTGGCLSEVTCGLLDIAQGFPLYEAEVRTVFRGLAQDAEHILVDEQMNVWQEVGQGRLLQELRRRAEVFHYGWIADEGCLVEAQAQCQTEQLYSVCFWQPRADCIEKQQPQANVQGTRKPSPELLLTVSGWGRGELPDAAEGNPLLLGQCRAGKLLLRQFALGSE